ncbi:uncharacterized protein CTRU02_212868 [Colletotrichum truncatum]|uniref:Uncharacterized protein n=1 Tax=Colletotrichum truncatum TaxID=5467 RepID=A0ACC3YJ57_COLTU
MESLLTLLSADEETFRELGISAPEDVLARYDAVAPELGLEGVTVPRGVRAGRELERAKQWHEYFWIILSELKETCLEEVRESITIPEELLVLAEHVDAVDGAGLPKYRGMHQIAFWWGLNDRLWGNRDYDRKTAARVKSPWELKSIAGLGHGWEVAGGWSAGEGAEGMFCVVYCRRRRHDGQEEGWAWRYTFVSHHNFSSWVFDTIPQLLLWYREFNEERLPVEEELNADDILAGLF